MMKRILSRGKLRIQKNFKFQEKNIRINSHIDEILQERLASDENENELLKLFGADIINKEDPIERLVKYIQ